MFLKRSSFIAAITSAMLALTLGMTSASATSGIDVASHQHPGGSGIDWNAVALSGQRFAFIKATEGTDYQNPYFTSDSAKASAAGIIPGSYHYARPAIGSAHAEAAYYAASLALAPDPSLPPVLDLESTGGLGPIELTTWIREWVREIQRLTGRDPIIYTYYNFWINNTGNSSEFSHLPLWLAYYSDSLPSSLPGGWGYATFWQHSDSGRVPGIVASVDLNEYHGTDAQLHELANSSGTSSPLGVIGALVAPIVGAATGEAGVANAIQSGIDIVTGTPGSDIPLPADVLIALIDFAHDDIDLPELIDVIERSGIVEDLADELERSAESADAGDGVPAKTLEQYKDSEHQLTVGETINILNSAIPAQHPDEVAAE